MALVRCSCLAQVVPAAGGGHDLRVRVLDPACGYVVHRLGAELAEPEVPSR
ncbi:MULTISPECIES: hypothetical protein [unclassified Nocardioides]|uniref:hypothetical protein n=1 Tax=unclassified Nocardioides TaxID=2615069 RepID=UPI0026651039|nr:hypothetical protein [Nocardioides sp. Arc9.136]WKN48129.1 hypothetical protein OSR43_19120 [Nocardioides sp. Arc9.136]